MISLRSRQRRRSNKNHEKSEEDPLLVKQKDECYVICSTLFYYVIQLFCSVDDVLWRNVEAMPAPVLIPHNLQRPSTIIQNFLRKSPSGTPYCSRCRPNLPKPRTPCLGCWNLVPAPILHGASGLSCTPASVCASPIPPSSSLFSLYRMARRSFIGDVRAE